MAAPEEIELGIEEVKDDSQAKDKESEKDDEVREDVKLFLEGLDPDVRARVEGLQDLQKQTDEVRKQYLAEERALLMRYEKLYQPLYDERAAVVRGDAQVAESIEAAKCGVPEFWLKVFQNHDQLQEMVTERDEECMKFMTDVESKMLETQGFSITFTFAENPFFTNKQLTKTYHLVIDGTEEVLDKADGCTIDWQADKNLTVIKKKKKQKTKKGKTRTQIKEEPCDSFFNFFKPPQSNQNEEEEDEDEDLDEAVQQDFDIGQMIVESIIPNAINWYTGEAVEMGGMMGDFDDDEEEEDEEDEEESDESGEKAPKPKKGGKKGKGAKVNAADLAKASENCKQQ